MTGSLKTKGIKPRITTIPSNQDFLKILAGYLFENYTDFEIAQHTIFLPTQRACQKFEQIMLEAAPKTATMLPRLIPLGQVEEDELSLTTLDGSEFGFALPPIISNEKRQLILTQIVFEFYKKRQTPISTSKASYLANALAQLIDQIEMEGLDLKNLETLAPQNYAIHWQTTLDFLNIIKDFWPQILSDENAIEFKKYHRLILEKLIDQWRDAPPATPIIVAGSTGSIPSTANLIKVVANLDNGLVILPGLDQNLDTEITAAHPQSTMQNLLGHVGAQALQVPSFVKASDDNHQFLCAVFDNRPTPENLAVNFDHINYVECAHDQEEAAVVATAVREYLENPQAKIQVVTPDRNLAERVINELNKWGVKTNDSGGKPLRRTALGSFILLTAEWLNAGLKTVDFLSALKHPYTQKYKFLANALEQYYFRAQATPLLPYQIADHLDGILKKLPAKFHHAMRDFVVELGFIKGKVDSLSDQSPLGEYLALHQTIVEWLTEDTFSSFEEMGQGSEMILFNQMWRNLKTEGDKFTLSEPTDYGPFLESFLLQIKARPHQHLHPRVQILGLIESRLIRSDVVILAGLNEGVWPPEPSDDPWFNQSMRQQFGLPDHDRRVGLSCLDFIHACGNKKVVITRSVRSGGTPTIPSRFLLKLQTGLKKQGLTLNQAPYLRDYVRQENPPLAVPCAPPAPCPKVTDRPRKLSVTEIEVLLKDPYAIYAKHVLKLKPLNDLDQDPGAKEFGIFLHRVFQLHIKKTPFNFQDLFDQTFKNSDHKKLWHLRVQKAYEWFQEQLKKCHAPHIHTEVFGDITFQSLGGPFTLTAIADRIDVFNDTAHIIDYKTGALPLTKNIQSGQSSQLPLEGVILRQGGFKNLKALGVDGLIFWHVTGKGNIGEIAPIKGPIDPLIKATGNGLKQLIHQFDLEDTPYRSHPHGIEGYGNYNHLARIKEWLT